MTLIRALPILLVHVTYFIHLSAMTYSNGGTEVDTSHDRLKRQAIGYERHLWRTGVNYYFDKNASNATREAFLRGANAWERDTCIKFTLNGSATDVIYVGEWYSVCGSEIGKVGGRQNLSLGEGCNLYGYAAHEIGHALGLHHTQNRYDRDEHIEINWENIEEDYKPQFNLTKWYEFTKYGLPYDYGSIMHYESNRTKPTMTPKKSHYMGTLGSPMISFIDLSMINEHYYCKTKCVGSSTKCENGGFPHPRNCSECICPGGYGGTLCNERPNDGGEVVNATRDWERLDTKHHNPNKDFDYLKKTYWIKPSSPAGEKVKIEVKMTRISEKLDVPGCVFAGVEIKNGTDQTVTGHSNSSHVVPVIFYSYGPPKIEIDAGLEYRYVKCQRG